MTGQRIKIVALSIDDVTRRYDDVGLDLLQFGNNAVEKYISKLELALPAMASGHLRNRFAKARQRQRKQH